MRLSAIAVLAVAACGGTTVGTTANVDHVDGGRAVDGSAGSSSGGSSGGATSPAGGSGNGGASSGGRGANATGGSSPQPTDAGSGAAGGTRASSDASGGVAGAPSGDGGDVCGEPLPATPPLPPSSLRDCTGGDLRACDFGEVCDYTVFDLLCYPPDIPCGGTQTGDERCHRACGDCASGEHCESRPVYVSDTPTQYASMCLCDDTSCAEIPIGLPAGGLDVWRDETPMPADVYYHAAAAGAGRLFVSGGLTIDTISGTSSATLAPVADVWSALVGALGAVGSWSTVGTLPEARQYHAMTVVGDRLYVAGGKSGPSTFDATVTSALIGGDGTLGPWRDEAPLPGPRGWHQLLTDGARLLVVGGSASSSYFTDGTSDIWVAPLGAGGLVGSWTTVQAPTPLYYGGGHAIGHGRLYVYTETGQLSSASLSDLGTWRGETPPQPTGGSGVSSYLRLLPLCDSMLLVTRFGNVATVPVDTGGALGTWRPGTKLAGPVSGFDAVELDGRAYVLGGTSGSPITRVDGVWSTTRL